MKKTLRISQFSFAADKVLVRAGVDELHLGSSMGYVAVNGFAFSPRVKGFLRDMVVVNAITMYGLFVDAIEVEVPVTKYVLETMEALLNAMNSWTSLFPTGPVRVPIHFHKAGSLTEKESRIFDAPDSDEVIVGWSEGKESKACIEMARELGQRVRRVFVGPGTSRGRDSIVSLCEEGTLRAIADIAERFPRLRGRHFVFQSNSGLGIYGALLLSCSESRSSRVLVGAEYSTGVSLDGKRDLGNDEGYVTIKWLNQYIATEYRSGVRIYSPVATLTEVGIIRFNLLKGIAFRDFESCWYFDKVGHRNCEGCTKCNRMKMYGLYLVNKGHMRLRDLEEAYTTLDYPRLSTPLTSAFSWISECIQRDIMSCDPKFDWSTCYLDHPEELEATGPYLDVVKRYFARSDWRRSTPVPHLRFNVFDNEYCRNEFHRIYGFDYWDHLPRDSVAQDGSSHLFKAGWSLPYEHLFYEGVDRSFTDWFSVWPVYDRDGELYGYVRIKDVPGYKWDVASGSRRQMPLMPAGSILRRWLVMDDVVRQLESSGIRYDFVRAAGG